MCHGEDYIADCVSKDGNKIENCLLVNFFGGKSLVICLGCLLTQLGPRSRLNAGTNSQWSSPTAKKLLLTRLVPTISPFLRTIWMSSVMQCWWAALTLPAGPRVRDGIRLMSSMPATMGLPTTWVSWWNSPWLAAHRFCSSTRSWMNRHDQCSLNCQLLIFLKFDVAIIHLNIHFRVQPPIPRPYGSLCLNGVLGTYQCSYMFFYKWKHRARLFSMQVIGLAHQSRRTNGWSLNTQ